MTPEELVEIEAIKRVKYAYVRCLDQKLWDEIGACFTDDAVAAYSGGKYSYEGREAIVAFLVRSMSDETFLSSHRVHHPEIDLTGPDTAVGTWALEDTVLVGAFGVQVRGAAFYSDEYRKVDGQWRISRTGYKRTFEEVEPLDRPGRRLTASWWGTDGQSELPA
jgi:hypothetical protein